jgi:hypothetical protein
LLVDVVHGLPRLCDFSYAHEIQALHVLATYYPSPSLLLVPREIESSRRILILLQTRHDLLGTQRLYNNARIPGTHKPTRDGVLDPIDQSRPVVIHVEHNDRHAVDPQLIPRRHLHQLLKGAVTPAQRNEPPAGPARYDFLGHQALARVHVVDDGCAAVHGGVDCVRGARGVVVGFQAGEGAWDDAVDGGGAGEGDEGAGDFAHQADGAAAVDERRVGGVQGVRQRPRRRHVHGRGAFGGAAAAGV